MKTAKETITVKLSLRPSNRPSIRGLIKTNETKGTSGITYRISDFNGFYYLLILNKSFFGPAGVKVTEEKVLGVKV